MSDLACPSGSGSQASPEAPSDLRLEGVDPSRNLMAPYGIIDPDYARVFTVARCIAWSEGYAMVMHGSFTRDLDLLAVPWDEKATDAEHLIRRIACALDDLDLLIKDPKAPSQATQKPHGRLAWTLTFKAFGDPRFIDISVMPRMAVTEDGLSISFEAAPPDMPSKIAAAVMGLGWAIPEWTGDDEDHAEEQCRRYGQIQETVAALLVPADRGEPA